MKFSIISPLCVLSEDVLNKTNQFFEDIKKSLTTEDEFIIIDNDSLLGKEMFMKNANIYVRSRKNLGYGGAINIGMKLASGDIYVFPNNDIRIDTTWREKMSNKYLSNQNLGALSYDMPSMIGATGTPFTGLFWSIRKEVKDRIGFFDEQYSLGREQDTDFLYRMLKSGFDLDTVVFELTHERRSTYNQPEFIKRYGSNLNYEDSPFEKKWNFHHNEWYRRGIKDRNYCHDKK